MIQRSKSGTREDLGIMTPIVSLTLPLPPSTNHLYERRKGGYELRLTEAARGYEFIVNRAVADLDLPEGYRLRPPLRVRIGLVLATRRRRDLDNSAKYLLDSLAFALGFDDDGIVELHLTKEVKRGCEEQCFVTVEELRP